MRARLIHLVSLVALSACGGARHEAPAPSPPAPRATKACSLTFAGLSNHTTIPTPDLEVLMTQTARDVLARAGACERPYRLALDVSVEDTRTAHRAIVVVTVMSGAGSLVGEIPARIRETVGPSYRGKPMIELVRMATRRATELFVEAFP